MKTIDLEDEMPGNFVHRFAGDAHDGSSAMSDHAIRSLVERVRSVKNSFVSFGGDQLESITVDDRRFAIEDHPGAMARIDAQRDDFIRRFKELEGKIKWVLDGNHERRWKNVVTPNADIAKALGSTYANGVMVKAVFPSFRVLDWHGAGVVNSRAGDAMQRATNEMIAVKRKLRLLPADDCELVVMHHIHKLVVHPPMRILHLVTDTSRDKLVGTYTVPAHIDIDASRGLYRVPEEEKWYVSSGSFLRGYMEGYSTYIEEAGYAAAELGVIKITVKNDKLDKVEKEYLL